MSVEVQHELDAALGRIVRIFAKPNRRFSERRSVAAGEPMAHAGGAAHSDPLQEARERGRLAAAREWEQPENLSLKDAALYAGRSDRAINQDRQAGRLYALVLPGRERGFHYPSWQFHVDSERLVAVLAPFVAAGASCWVIHNFLHRPQEGLEGRTPADCIADAAAPIDAVVRLVDARYRDEQGAA
ncbi:integrase [Cupriavidus necator]